MRMRFIAFIIAAGGLAACGGREPATLEIRNSTNAELYIQARPCETDEWQSTHQAKKWRSYYEPPFGPLPNAESDERLAVPVDESVVVELPPGCFEFEANRYGREPTYARVSLGRGEHGVWRPYATPSDDWWGNVPGN